MTLPNFLKPCLKSYSLKALDKNKDKEKIIFLILNFGNFQAIKWLMKNYSLAEIKKVLNFKNSSWNFLSYSFWCKILKVKPKNKNYALLPSFKVRHCTSCH
jgi:hypothetical protein